MRILLVVWILLATAAATVAGQTCPLRQPVAGHPGFDGFVCYGGNCRIAVRDGDRIYHEFTVEPQIRGIIPNGPAAGRLREQDVVVAIDGHLITTRAGGERMAGLAPGRVVILRIRRGPNEMDVAITPRAECHRPGIAISSSRESEEAARELLRRIQVGRVANTAEGEAVARLPSGPVDSGALSSSRGSEEAARDMLRRILAGRMSSNGEGEAVARLPRGPVDFGLSLACGACGWRRVADQFHFWTEVFPIIVAVLPDGPAARAGALPGDTLIALDGRSITGSIPDSVWNSLPAAETVRLTVRRGRTIDLWVKPERVRF